MEVASAAALAAVASFWRGTDATKQWWKWKPAQHRESGLRTIQDAAGAEVDIVLVDGLRTDSFSFSTLTLDSGASTSSALHGLGAQLSSNLSVPARITIYDYDSNFRTPEYLTRRTLLHQTSRLIQDLAEWRRGHSTLPIVFVCHSLGGIVVKNALVGAHNSPNPELRSVFSAVRGIVFLGTPHSGSPVNFATDIARIVGQPNPEILQELRERSITLAYSVERFKPLAHHFRILSFLESSPELRPELDAKHEDSASSASYVKGEPYIRNNKRNHAHVDLKTVIDAINEASLNTRGTSASPHDTASSEPGVPTPEVIRQNKMPSLGLPGMKETMEMVPLAAIKPRLEKLNELFGRWSGSPSSDITARPQDPWPVIGLYGDQGCGKTQTALRYYKEACQRSDRYGSLIWINAATRKSIELSFREAERRIADAHRLDEPAGMSEPSEEKDLDDEELHALVLRVMEWMEQPQRRKWLLVLDNLTRKSPFPSQSPWICRPSRAYTWRELLRLIPSVSGWNGHVIICTRDKLHQVEGLNVILCKNPPSVSSSKSIRASGSWALGRTQIDPLRQIVQWWCDWDATPSPPWQQDTKSWWLGLDSTARTRMTFALALFLTDKDCPRVPLSIFGGDEDQYGDWTREWPDVAFTICDCRDGRYVLLPDFVLNDGLRQIVHKLRLDPAEFANALVQLASRSLDSVLSSRRLRHDPVSGWDGEAQLVKNATAMMRRWEQLSWDVKTLTSLPQRSIKTPRNIAWARMARICQNHSAYGTAAKFYHLQMEQGPHNDDAEGRKYQLLYDRASLLAEKDDSRLPSTYENILSDNQAPRGLLITTYRQLASWHASHGRYMEAIAQLSEALALDKPDGTNANEPQITKFVGELAAYLVHIGNRSSASSLLHRLILSLQHTKGMDDLSTLIAMEALSTLKQEEGELGEARAILERIHESQERRLGEEHPATILIWSQVAAVRDLEGHPRLAESIYHRCLERAVRRLGPGHPSVFGIRENLARCLLVQGKMLKARTQFKILQDEINRLPGLYSNAVRGRIYHCLEGKGTADDFELDLHLSKRNTLGIGDLDDYDSDDTGDEMSEFWDGEMEDHIGGS